MTVLERVTMRFAAWLAQAALALGLLSLVACAAHAAEQNGTPDGAGTSATLPSGVTVTLTATADPTFGGTTFTAGGSGFSGQPAANYSPSTLNLGAAGFNLTTAATAPAVPVGQERAKGTLTITFSSPINNPRLHFARLGGFNGSEFQATSLVLTSGGSLTSLTPSALQIVGGTRMQTTSTAPSTACGSPATTSGCGTIQVNGTFSSLTFNVFLQHRSGIGAFNQSADAYGLIVTADEDFTDAPASYGVASHLVDRVFLGASAQAGGGAHPAEADAVDTMYAAMPPATSPVASNTAAGDTDNALSSALPLVGVGTYPLTVPVSAVTGSASGSTVCGWIDFNRNGTFEAGERACGTAGAANASLSWTIPTGATYVAGQSYIRLRIAETAAQLTNATGAATTGEVEDYQITLQPRVQLTKALSPTTDTGRFNLAISLTATTAIGPGTPAVTNIGHNGTTGFVPVPFGSAITVSETGNGTTVLTNYTSTMVCRDRANVVVSAAGATTTATFNSMTSAPAGPPTTPATAANSNASEISCIVTNTTITATLQLAKAWAAGSLAGNQVSIGATSGGTNAGAASNTAAFNAIAPNPANSGAPVVVTAGNVITLPAEGGVNVANYTTVLGCTGGHTLSGTDGQAPNTLTITSANAAVCTYTNTPRPASLQLAKAWVGGIAGEQVTIGATTGGTNDTIAFDATAPTAATSGAPVVVNIGNVITLPAEGGANVANFTTTLACTGGHTLSGTDGQTANTLTITNPAAAVCTYTNTRRGADLVLTKTNALPAGTCGSDIGTDTVTAGAVTTYTICVTNVGPGAVTGAVVTDTPAPAGLTCPGANPATGSCSGPGCPAATFPVASLTGSGVVLGNMTAGQTAILTFTCDVN